MDEHLAAPVTPERPSAALEPIFAVRPLGASSGLSTSWPWSQCQALLLRLQRLANERDSPSARPFLEPLAVRLPCSSEATAQSSFRSLLGLGLWQDEEDEVGRFPVHGSPQLAPRAHAEPLSCPSSASILVHLIRPTLPSHSACRWSGLSHQRRQGARPRSQSSQPQGHRLPLEAEPPVAASRRLDRSCSSSAIATGRC